MGFYGNITNTSNTTFSFDRIYPNRLAMDANANNDGVFIGRYVLVEYQEEAAYPVAYHATETSEDSGQYYFYSSTNQEEISKIKYLGLPPGEPDHLPSVDDVNAIYQDGFYKGEILQRYIYSSDKKDWVFSEEFYACVGEDDKHFAVFELITNPSMKSHYIQNFEIDEKHYGQESKGFKGYDSTVWMKSSVTASNGKLITKYVNIADLNSVVPTFDIAADAPTMTPITPHFDADSTNVYYKLHAQPQWGFRIAKAHADGDTADYISDADTQWTKIDYNPSTDKTDILYASGINDENQVPIWEGDSSSKIPAAIFYNARAFEKQIGEISIDKYSKDITEDKIEITTGKSGNEYNLHNGKQGPDKGVQNDTQELTIHLPSIGNMMSDAWDIIHGKQRNDYRGDGENASLQGRLDAFEEIKNNQIPVKREKDGTLVGSMINHATPYVLPEGKDILSEEAINAIPENIYDGDDPWIATSINTDLLIGGQKLNENGEIASEYDQTNNSGISIHHSFHPVLNSKTAHDKNKTSNWYSDESESNEFLQENKLPITNRETKNDDTIKLYTPYVDAKGHVVGKNIETVTLPYSFKTVKAKAQSVAVTNPNTNTNEVIADSTQDTLQFASSNKWIRMSGSNSGTGVNYDTFNIGHEVHSIDETVSDQGDNETSHTNANKESGAENEINLTMYDWTYDEAGHITSKRQHTYTLPYGFKTINVGNNTTESAAPTQMGVEGETADSTQDSLTLTPTNKWIKMVATGNNEIKFGHELTEINSKSDTDFGLSSNMSIAQVDANNNQFNIPVFQFDKAGHITKAETHKVQLPNGFTTFTSTISDIDNEDSTSGKAGNFSPDTMTDTITLAEGNQWINIEASEDTFTFKHYAQDFNKEPELTYDFNNSNSTDSPNTFITTDWKKDRAGHLIEGQDTKYTLPNGIKTLSIQDTGKDNVSIVTGSTGQLIADNLVDIMTIDNGNRWIRLVANGKTVKLYHDAPNSASGSTNTTNANNNNNKTLSFNSTFEVPQVKYDETGHIFGIDKHTITLPSTSTLRLNNYSKGTSTAAITTNETINNAFGKLENRLDLLQGDKDVVGSVDNKISIEVAKILDDADPSDIDTLNEIAGWIINDTTGAAKMANDISDLKTKMGSSSVATQITNKINALDKPDTVVEGQYVSAVSEANGIITVTRESLPTLSTGSINGTIKLGNDNEVAVKGLGSAAFTESTAYAKSDVLDTKFKYGATEEQKTIADLMNKVAELEIKLNELNNQINPPQET